LGVEEKPIITVLNKIDALEKGDGVDELTYDFPDALKVSARTGENIPLLLKRIQEHFAPRMVEVEAVIAHGKMDLVNKFYEEGKVKEIDYLQDGIHIKANIPVLFYHKVQDSSSNFLSIRISNRII
jgi:GTP-binding protein HflX